MLFNSLTYVLIFLPLAVIAYWFAPDRARLWIILLASLIFYGFWRLEFIPLMLFSAAADFVIARMIDESDNEKSRRILLIISIFFSVLILFVFKYLMFFVSSIGSIASIVGLKPGWFELNIVLPLGISFYIFATISYTVDVYRRIVPAEKNPLVYFCFVTFYPHLVAGPILRAGVLIPQLANRPSFRGADIPAGIKLIIKGLFLKVVLADNIAVLVGDSFGLKHYDILHGVDAWTMAFLFGFQIYFDFAGYSLVAIGSARLMGIFLPANFDYPYLATSPRDFWKRWHISLSTWVRDYLYMPLMGSRPKGEGWEAIPQDRGDREIERRRTWSLFATWTLMGLWHGANWTFMIWGLFHATWIWAQRLMLAKLPSLRRAPPVLGWVITLPLMMAAWIPFRSRSVSDAITLWGKMINPHGFFDFGLWTNNYVVAAALMLGFLVWCAMQRWLSVLSARRGALLAFESVGWGAAIALVFVFLQVRDQFIYFQF